MTVLRPTGLAELAASIGERPDAVLYGGGTLIVPRRRGQLRPTPLICLTAVPDLRTAGADHRGAATTMAELAGDGRLPAAIRDAAASIGGPATRAMATVGGNVAGAAPGCLAVALLALDASADVLDPDGAVRTVPLGAVVGSPRRPIVAVRWNPARRAAFGKVRAAVSGPVVVTLAVGGCVRPAAPHYAVSLGGPGRTPRRLPAMEALLCEADGPGPVPDMRDALAEEGLPHGVTAIAAHLIRAGVAAMTARGPA